MQKQIAGFLLALCTILFLAACSARDPGASSQERSAPADSSAVAGDPANTSTTVGDPANTSTTVGDPANTSAAAGASSVPDAPPLSSFHTMILAEGDKILPEDYYDLTGETLAEFQDALMVDRWRDPGDWQGKGEFPFPCVIVEGENNAVLYISPANRDNTFDETVIYFKYGQDQRCNAVFLAPGEVAQKADALRQKLRETVRPTNAWTTSYIDWFGQDDPTLSSHPHWEHLESRNWQEPQAYAAFRLSVQEIPGSEISGALCGEWPERVYPDGNTILWDGGFANGPIKIGEIQQVASTLSDPWGLDQNDGGVYRLPVSETTVFDDRVALDHLKQTDSYQRYLTAAYPSETAPSIVRYLVKLDEDHAASLFFFISPALTSEELERYDALVTALRYEA